MKDGKIKISHRQQDWWGFTLQQGHAFGLFQGVCYVSAAVPDPNRHNHIIMYKKIRGKNYDRWTAISIPRHAAVAQAFIDAIIESPFAGVTFKAERYNGSTWTPTFPTYQSKRPERTPRLPSRKPPKTYVDAIIAQCWR